MNGSITRFLEDKEDGILSHGGLFIEEDDRIYRYPIQFTMMTKEPDGFTRPMLYNGWVADAHEEVIQDENHNNYTLHVVVLMENKTQYVLVTKKCTVRCGSSLLVDWDNISCSHDLVNSQAKRTSLDLEVVKE